MRVLFSLLRQSGEHIFDKDAVAAGGVAHENVGHRADELSVLDDRTAAHECVNIRLLFRIVWKIHSLHQYHFLKLCILTILRS